MGVDEWMDGPSHPTGGGRCVSTVWDHRLYPVYDIIPRTHYSLPRTSSSPLVACCIDLENKVRGGPGARNAITHGIPTNKHVAVMKNAERHEVNGVMAVYSTILIGRDPGQRPPRWS